MKNINQHFTRSALAAQVIATCPSAECARHESMGVVIVAYGSPMATQGENVIDT